MRLPKFATALLAALPCCVFAASAQAQVPEIKLGRQFSMGYLQFNTMEHHKLIEKHAKALGLPEVKVSWVTINGPDNINAALLSGNLDIAAGGTPGLLTLWARTKGTPQEVKGISAFMTTPNLINTRDPNIKGIEDFTDKHRIAVPAVKIALQAILLQMAAAKKWGPENYDRLDKLTVSMSPPDATSAIMSGVGEVTAVFAVPPFQYQQLEAPGVRTILSSYDIMGGPHAFSLSWTTSKFRDGNPKLYQAFYNAFTEATAMVDSNKRAAGELWIAAVKSKMTPDQVEKIVAGKDVVWSMTPVRTMEIGRFMNQVGTLKVKPESWKDYFFPEIHGAPGS